MTQATMPVTNDSDFHRMSVRIPIELHQRLKAVADRSPESQHAIILIALDKEIKAREKVLK